MAAAHSCDIDRPSLRRRTLTPTPRHAAQ
jgi:hypothetical protein